MGDYTSLLGPAFPLQIGFPGEHGSFPVNKQPFTTPFTKVELRQKFCYPREDEKGVKSIRCARSDCYRGRNGSNDESEDTDRTNK